MAEKCKASYKNLNRIQSFSEQRYATVQLMQQACMNDEWLKQQVERLSYLSPPAVRKTFSPILVDDAQSWGYQVNSNNQVTFSSETKKVVFVDFTNSKLIDEDKTTAEIEEYVVDEQEIDDSEIDEDGQIPDSKDTSEKPIKRRCCLHTEIEIDKTKAKWDYSTKTSDGGGANSAWYVGWNKSKPYYVRPDWIKNWKDREIPAVCRAQTFTSKSTGKLVSVDLKLEYNGTNYSNCGSPLYVQIWKTKRRFVPKTTWDTKKNTYHYIYIKDPKNGKYDKYKHYTKKSDGTYKRDDKNGEYVHKREYIYWPDTKKSGITKPLAEAVYSSNPSKSQGGFPNILFNKPCKVTKNHHYAIVLFSPLSEWKHCPRWAGWGRNCHRDQKYKGGDAFLSENNGRTWIRHGRNDDKVDYKHGKKTPQDFAFKCHIRTRDATTTPREVYTDETEYLYLKPIYANPIKSVFISGQDYGETKSQDKVHIQYQISTTGDDDDWHTVSNTEYNLTKPSNVIFVRAKLWRSTNMQSNGTDSNDQETPYIENIRVELTTDLPEEMYVRTHYYYPPLPGETMLGANLWGRIYTPFTVEPTVDCTVEIIKEKQVQDHIKIITVDELDESLVDLVQDIDSTENPEDLTEDEKYLKKLYKNIVNKNSSERVEYLNTNKDAITELKKHSIYIKPEQIENTYHKLSFAPVITGNKTETDNMIGGITLHNNVAYPIHDCKLQPDGEEDVKYYGEWYDFKFDYTTNELIFTKDRLDEMPIGGLNITYNQVFIDGLTIDEVGVRKDPETGLIEEGLVLDYFKENIVVTRTEIETRRIPLRVKPVDPIRSVILNKDTDSERTLVENHDYHLDIDTNELVFEVNNEDGKSSILNLDDDIEIVYTPYLEDIAISIGYHAKRTSKDKQVYIDGNYLEYKV